MWRLTQSGGVQTVVRSILRHADKDEFEFHVCSVRPLEWDRHAPESPGGASMHSLGFSGKLSAVQMIPAAVGLIGLMRRVRPDVLHLHGGTAVLGLPAAVACRRCTKLIEIHDAPDSGRFSSWTLRVERWLGTRGGLIPVVHSEAVRTGVADAWDLARSRIRMIPLGIETRHLTPVKSTRLQTRKAISVPENAKLVLYVARLVPEKRPDLFLLTAREVLKTSSDAHFVLAGDGSQLGELRRMAEGLGIAQKVSIPGFVEDLSSLYASADLFLSTSRYEGWGLAVAEAMAAGLPVVATNVGGVGEVLGDSGVLVDADAPLVLGRVVADLLDDPQRMSRLGHAAAARARSSLDIRRSVNGFEEVYRLQPTGSRARS